MAPRFAAYFKVRHYEMDALGHVNNAVYLQYFEHAAHEHSDAAGFGLEQTRDLGGGWVARRHEIDYLRPAVAADILQVVTWGVEFKGARATREYAIYRIVGATQPPPNAFLPPDWEPPGEPLVRARTEWVWLDPVSGRPKRIPAEMYPAFLGADAS